MNKNTMLIVGAVVAVLVLGGLGYYLTQNDDDNSQSSNTSNQSADTSQAESQEQEHSEQQGNLFSVASGGKAQQCDMSYSSESGTGTGKMYTDGQGRGLMTMSVTTSKGNTAQSNTLVTSDKVYSWSASGEQKIGFVFNKTTYSSQSSNQSSSSSANANQNFNLDCHSWTVDQSKLAVPSDVTFTSLPGQ